MTRSLALQAASVARICVGNLVTGTCMEWRPLTFFYVLCRALRTHFDTQAQEFALECAAAVSGTCEVAQIHAHLCTHACARIMSLLPLPKPQPAAGRRCHSAHLCLVPLPILPTVLAVHACSPHSPFCAVETVWHLHLLCLYAVACASLTLRMFACLLCMQLADSCSSCC